jgi:predicted permease
MVELANILVPILLIAMVGFALERTSVEVDTNTLGTIVLLVATPCLIFHTLVSMNVHIATLGQMAWAALLAMTISGALGLAVLLMTGASKQAYLPSLIFPNSGNMGLGLVLLAFGDEGLKLGISYFFMVSTLQHSIGFSIAAGTLDLRRLARQPLLYSVILVLVVTLFSIEVPQIIMSTTQMLGAMMVPAMLMVLGASLATFKVANLKPALGIGVARLALGLISGVLVIWLLDLDGIAAGTVFLLATMPTAIVNHIYAQQYGAHGVAVSGAIAVSTLLTLLCLPGLIWIALRISDHV